VTLDPADERERVHRTYAALSRRGIAGWCLVLVALLVLGRFLTVHWWHFVGMLAGLVAWEVTKLRLRRNADHFAAPRR
jgi:hypothetical protein